MSTVEVENPALKAAREADAEVLTCLDAKKDFLLEAGAGAGKTYSLVEALWHLIDTEGANLRKRNQRIACITYTNAATAVINARIDRSDLVFTDTIHSFCWSLVKGYQTKLRNWVKDAAAWEERLMDAPAVETQTVEYELGYRRIDDAQILLHHDDVLLITAELIASPKFQVIVADRYPYILIDEYQDSDAEMMQAIVKHLLGRAGGPLIGLFGDHWQRIYDATCGHVKHSALHEIGKKANFRSTTSIVKVLNNIRKELPQAVKDASRVGEVNVYHTNSWVGARRTGAGGGHWKDDLPADVAHEYLDALLSKLRDRGWDFDAKKTKILMLTHNVLAQEQGYRSITEAFDQTDRYIKKEDDYIAFFADQLEPACDAFAQHRYGQMFAALGTTAPRIQAHKDKVRWTEFMAKLMATRQEGTVADVLQTISAAGLIRLPDSVVKREENADNFVPVAGEEIPKRVASARTLRQVAYREVIALNEFINGYTPFATKHSVKGDEFENVLVVLGRGWNKYNFDQYLQWVAQGGPPEEKVATFERNRNLFYVACSRATTRLTLLFTQKLSEQSLGLLKAWFGDEAVTDFTL